MKICPPTILSLVREILVAERRSGGRIERYWAYEMDDWSRRGVAGLPPGTHMVIHDSTRVVVIDASGVEAHGTPTRLLLWHQGAVVPLADIYGRPGPIVWSPDGRRLALATAIEEPAGGPPASLVTSYAAYLIEPQSRERPVR
jgi:hypothetical protein